MKKTEENILVSVSHKIKKKFVKIAIISSLSCLIVISSLLITFVKESNIKYSSNLFKTTNSYTNDANDNRSVTITTTKNWSSMRLYIENNDDNKTATLYFYLKSNIYNDIMNKQNPVLSKYDLNFNTYPVSVDYDDSESKKDVKNKEITKIYYLIYDFDNFKQNDFDKVKGSAKLIWEK